MGMHLRWNGGTEELLSLQDPRAKVVYEARFWPDLCSTVADHGQSPFYALAPLALKRTDGFGELT